MNTIYTFVTGPLQWAAWIICIGGAAFKLIQLALLARKKDPMVYEYMSASFAMRSLLHWLVPYRSENMRKNPMTTFVSFLFHICLLATPIFLMAHVLLWHENFEISWWYLPDWAADVMTVIVLIACVYFWIRRLRVPQVRYLTSAGDFWLLAMVAAPFVTGFWAQHQFPGALYMTIAHVLCGELFLVALPFTRLAHMFYFLLTRSYMGSEFGAVRHAEDW